MSASPAVPLSAERPFTQRNVAFIPLWLLLTGNIYWMVWLYKSYKEIRQHSPTATTITPGKAVGFMFIPLFNFYWAFRVLFDFPRSLARVEAKCWPSDERLPSGSITAMMITAFVLNALGGNLHPSLFVGGEVLLATALITCQLRMNEHTHPPSVQAETRKQTLADLIGASGSSVDWGRASAFAVACILQLALIGPSYALVFGGNLSLELRSVAWALSLGLFTAAGGVIGFRYVRNDWLAALAATGIFAVGQVMINLLISKSYGSIQELAFVFFSQFLAYAALAFFLRLVPSLWLAVLLGTAFAEFTDSAASLFYMHETWYSSLALLISQPVAGASNLYYSARIQVFRPLFDLENTLVFTFSLWLAHRIWVGERTNP